jgi:hypothetical protein
MKDKWNAFYEKHNAKIACGLVGVVALAVAYAKISKVQNSVIGIYEVEGDPGSMMIVMFRNGKQIGFQDPADPANIDGIVPLKKAKPSKAELWP